MAGYLKSPGNFFDGPRKGAFIQGRAHALGVGCGGEGVLRGFFKFDDEPEDAAFDQSGLEQRGETVP